MARSLAIYLVVGFLIALASTAAFVLTQRGGTTPTSTSSRTGINGAFSIGYVGCSNTADAVAGYYMVQNMGLFWRPYATGGGSLDRWTSTSSQYWTLFDQQLQRYGQPAKVWVEICEMASHPLNFSMTQQVIAILKSKSPSATVYISPLNSYSPPGICSLTGPNGVADATRLANEAASNGLATSGPILGPLTQQNTNQDLCHPNTAGEELLGSQLVAFFDDGLRQG